jgi:hypothetical protein
LQKVDALQEATDNLARATSQRATDINKVKKGTPDITDLS